MASLEGSANIAVDAGKAAAEQRLTKHSTQLNSPALASTQASVPVVRAFNEACLQREHAIDLAATCAPPPVYVHSHSMAIAAVNKG